MDRGNHTSNRNSSPPPPPHEPTGADCAFWESPGRGSFRLASEPKKSCTGADGRRPVQWPIGWNGALCSGGDRVVSVWNRLMSRCRSPNAPKLAGSPPGWRRPGGEHAGDRTSGPVPASRYVLHQAHHGAPGRQDALRPTHPDGMPRSRPVHRLDKATAGARPAPPAPRAAASLGAAFLPIEPWTNSTWPCSGRYRRTGHARLDGKDAELRRRVLDHGTLPVHGEASLLEVRPTTGPHPPVLPLPSPTSVTRSSAKTPTPPPAWTSIRTPSWDGLFLCAIGLSIPKKARPRDVLQRQYHANTSGSMGRGSPDQHGCG